MKYKLNKRLGQHFLFDESILKRIAEAVTVTSGQKIIEIGPGAGSLTRYLIEKKIPVVSVELDNRWADEIQKKFTSDSNFTVVKMDALDFEWNKYGKTDQLVVAGNIPYQITSPLIFTIIDHRNYINSCVFLMQKEVAERISASPGSKSFGITSIAVQYFFETEILFDVPPQAFTPPPKVHSSVLRLKKIKPPRSDVKNWSGFMNFIHQVFNQRRKMLRNSLKSRLENIILCEELQEYLTKRPEQLSLDQMIHLYHLLEQK